MESDGLKQVFLKFTAGKPEMDNKTFAKVSKDCKVLDKKLTSTDVDLCFAKVKTSSSVRNITYDQFSKGVAIWAEKKGTTYENLVNAIVSAGGPQYTGTQGGSKFHDDKTTYTGAYKQNQQEESKEDTKQQSQQSQQQQKGSVQTSECQAGSLQEVFDNFAKGVKDIDGKTFAKIAKDTKCLDKKLTATDIDLIFPKIVIKGQRRITYAQFVEGVKLMAAKKGISFDELSTQICKCGGPILTGTQADKVKFHDDKNLYTGVYAKGGPTNVDKDKISDISQTCDRTSANVRGVKQ